MEWQGQVRILSHSSGIVVNENFLQIKRLVSRYLHLRIRPDQIGVRPLQWSMLPFVCNEEDLVSQQDWKYPRKACVISQPTRAKSFTLNNGVKNLIHRAMDRDKNEVSWIVFTKFLIKSFILYLSRRSYVVSMKLSELQLLK